MHAPEDNPSADEETKAQARRLDSLFYLFECFGTCVEIDDLAPMSATASISGAIKFLAQFAGTSTFENATLLRAIASAANNGGKIDLSRARLDGTMQAAFAKAYDVVLPDSDEPVAPTTNTVRGTQAALTGIKKGESAIAAAAKGSSVNGPIQKIIVVDGKGGEFIFDNDPDALDAMLAARAASGAVNRMLGAMA